MGAKTLLAPLLSLLAAPGVSDIIIVGKDLQFKTQ